MPQDNILVEEQARFRKGRSSLDNFPVLQHLDGKIWYLSLGNFYVAFIDLKASFDLIPRNRFYKTLIALCIVWHLLFLVL